MSKHEKEEDPKDKYKDNGHKPGEYPYKERGGKHEKPDTDETDKDDKDEKK